VTTDDLSAPLGQDQRPKHGRTLPRAVPSAVAAALGLFVVVLAGWAMVADDPFGGEPWAVVPADLAANTPDKTTPEKTTPAASASAPAAASERAAPGAAAAAPAAPAGRTVTIIDGTSGKRQEIQIPAPADERPGGDADARLTEASPHGPLPKVAPDGARAAQAYAQPVKVVAGKAKAPRIAIVVGGLGIGSATTRDALGKLPAAVTLALAPYGNDLVALAARARGEGHEVLLQVPMEPFDYPDNDPGPHTLLTSLDSGQNVDRLHWLMSRFQGYVGIVNSMGARFTASEPALAPVLRETGKRGLLYLDDGSSPRSLASQIAGANNLAFAKADVILDALPTAADVERALGRLETTARERGVAVGIAGALPVSIERIAKWAKAAEGRGLLLVPISAVATPAADDKRRTTENRTTDDRGRTTENR
jgi:polysaccharide deacetylase 2 family uncharacterized protein YibQ